MTIRTPFAGLLALAMASSAMADTYEVSPGQQMAPSRASAINGGMAETVRIPGAVDGFSTTDKDGVVDAALVIPTLSASSVFRFDLESLLAPDERAKAGPISADVPGNTYIPRQKEKYGFLTVTLEKDEFGFYTQAGEENELSALWFSAPWDLLIEASKGNVNMTALLKAAKFRKAGFAGLKDWSRERKINLSLDRELRAQGSIKWTRGAAPKDYGDMVVVFQSTPSGRWALSGFDGNPAETTPFSTFDGFPQRVKVLGVRSKFAEDGNVLAAEGWIVDADRRSKITFTGVPAPLKGGAIVGKNVHWLNPGGPGWMGVMHQVQVPKVADAPLPSLFDGIFPFSKFLPNNTAEASVTWVDPTLETAPLPATYKAGDRLMLVLVGTSREVSAPRDGEQEPELFTYAQSLRSVVVK